MLLLLIQHSTQFDFLLGKKAPNNVIDYGKGLSLDANGRISHRQFEPDGDEGFSVIYDPFDPSSILNLTDMSQYYDTKANVSLMRRLSGTKDRRRGSEPILEDTSTPTPGSKSGSGYPNGSEVNCTAKSRPIPRIYMPEPPEKLIRNLEPVHVPAPYKDIPPSQDSLKTPEQRLEEMKKAANEISKQMNMVKNVDFSNYQPNGVHTREPLLHPIPAFNR